ncbi:hypothetical protein AB205_0130180 [Aquarana catesbeiana]|uniref:Uncharacterized protein n=1 Tax=Aquarana catesbeiana TaxID=8400 RepID=A0A2G9RA39_AQUCT|nr:hypothetical protein AB205_0130180 [Aquarana catesbeiana]
MTPCNVFYVFIFGFGQGHPRIFGFCTKISIWCTSRMKFRVGAFIMLLLMGVAIKTTPAYLAICVSKRCKTLVGKSSCHKSCTYRKGDLGRLVSTP